MANKEREQRACLDTKFRVLRSEGDPPKIEGYAAVFNRETDLGWFAEKVAPGAFRDSITRGDDVRALFNHDPSLILGRTKAGTLELLEDDFGLFCRITPPDTQLGRDLTQSIERGDISQMSFGFTIDEETQVKRDGDKTLYVLNKVSLFDVSPVTFPAYEDTKVSIQRQERMQKESQSSRRSPIAEKEKRDRFITLLRLGN